MGDKNRRPDTPASAEAMFGPARPAFGRVRKGYDPSEVTPYLDMLERERADLGAALVLTQARARELSAKLERYEALEAELTRTVHQASESAAAVVAEAEARAARIVADAEARAAEALAEGREALAAETRELDALHMAIAAEAANLAALEESSGISRAAAALVALVDEPGGLGPFSQATSTLIEFAQLLQRTARAGAAPDAATIDLTGEVGPAEEGLPAPSVGPAATTTGTVRSGAEAPPGEAAPASQEAARLGPPLAAPLRAALS